MINRLTTVISHSSNPYYNLALEEYLLKHTAVGDCILYLWQNKNTVVIGRNQNVWRECRIEELKKTGGCVARRLSGGGAVYHDLGNLNFTFLVRKQDYDEVRQTGVILNALRNLGIVAERTGRNDILTDGKKISGHAYFETTGYCYHHGTIMVCVDKEKLSKYLNVNLKKLKAKGVESVVSRVANLTDYVENLSVEQVARQLCASFEEEYGQKAECISIFRIAEGRDREKAVECLGNLRGQFEEKVETGQIDKEQLVALKEKYQSWEWLFGRNKELENSVARQFFWGMAEVSYRVTGGRIQEMVLCSDSLYPELIDQMNEKLCGIKYTREELEQRFQEILEERTQNRTGETKTKEQDEMMEREILMDLSAWIMQQIV